MVDTVEGTTRPRLMHVTTVDMSLWLLLRTQLTLGLAAGFEVFGASAPGPFIEYLRAIGVHHVAVPSFTRSWSPLRDLQAARELRRAIHAVRPDVLHVHTPKAAVLGRILGRAAGVPVVVSTCHGLWLRPGDSRLRHAAVLGVEALAARFSDAELYVNRDDPERLSKLLGSHRIEVVGGGVDLTEFYPDPLARRAVRRELGISEDELVVGAVGRRVHEKGLREFVETARQLRHRARFVWVGPAEGGESGSSDRVAGDDAVHFVGLRTDMRAVYSAFDIFVLPSYREGLPRSAMEAAACELPLVLTDIRGCRDIGEPGEHAIFVPAGDTTALAQATSWLINHPCAARAMAERARARAVATFDEQRVFDRYLATYLDVAVAKGRRLALADGGALRRADRR